MVGALLVLFGFFWAVDGLAEAWAGHTYAGDRVAAEPAFWFVDRFGAFLLMQLPLLLVLYPTGRFMTGRWGVAGRVAVVMSASLPVMLLVAPTAALDIDGAGTPTDSLSDATALPLPVAVAEPLLVVSRLLTFAALLLALVVVFARHRRAADAERSQLRWLLWAGVICVVQLGIGLVFPEGVLPYLAIGSR